MTKEQLDAIVGLLVGTQTAIVTLSDYLSKTGVLNKDELSTHFSATADLLPSDLQNRSLIAMILRQVSSGIASTQENNPEAEIRQLLH